MVILSAAWQTEWYKETQENTFLIICEDVSRGLVNWAGKTWPQCELQCPIFWGSGCNWKWKEQGTLWAWVWLLSVGILSLMPLLIGTRLYIQLLNADWHQRLTRNFQAFILGLGLDLPLTVPLPGCSGCSPSWMFWGIQLLRLNSYL